MVASSTRRKLEEGFAAVDALVALMILATTIVLSIRAVETAKQAAAAAEETRQASQVVRDVFDTSPKVMGSLDGRSPGFSWRLVTQAAATQTPIQGIIVCQRTVKLVATATGRSYTAATTELCPPATRS